MKSQALHTVWCNISGGAAGEIDHFWEWKGLIVAPVCMCSHAHECASELLRPREISG